MEETPEQKEAREAEEAAVKEAADGVIDKGADNDEEKGRPEINYQKELERKNKELERMRQAVEASKAERPNKRDPEDMSTWADHELKTIMKSNDPTVLPYKDKAEDIMLERKVQSLREKERMQEKRAMSDLELRSKFPDALNPDSALSVRMEELTRELDLQKSPSGRLAAARLASAELNKGRSSATEKERKAEADRIARVKGHMVDGDRSRSAGGEGPKKLEDIENKTRSEGILQTDGFKEAMKVAGLDRDSFFPKR